MADIVGARSTCCDHEEGIWWLLADASRVVIVRCHELASVLELK